MAVAAPFPTGPFYVLGALLLVLGFLLLTRGEARRTRTVGPPRGDLRRLVAPAAAFVAGVIVIGSAGYVDTVRWMTWNTRYMTYRASVHINGTGPVTLVLPAPMEARFWSSLNVTNGTSSLRLIHTATDTYVVLLAAADVAFDVRAEFVDVSLTSNLTHLSFADGGPYSLQANVTIQMSAVEAATTAYLTLDISFGDFCSSRWYSMNAVIQQGSAMYPIEMPPTPVC